jgi:hypothetical protein
MFVYISLVEADELRGEFVNRSLHGPDHERTDLVKANFLSFCKHNLKDWLSCHVGTLYTRMRTHCLFHAKRVGVFATFYDHTSGNAQRCSGGNFEMECTPPHNFVFNCVVEKFHPP